MNKKRLLIAAMTALMLAFGPVAVGCTSSSSAGNSGKNVTNLQKEADKNVNKNTANGGSSASGSKTETGKKEYPCYTIDYGKLPSGSKVEYYQGISSENGLLMGESVSIRVPDGGVVNVAVFSGWGPQGDFDIAKAGSFKMDGKTMDVYVFMPNDQNTHKPKSVAEFKTAKDLVSANVVKVTGVSSSASLGDPAKPQTKTSVIGNKDEAMDYVMNYCHAKGMDKGDPNFSLMFEGYDVTEGYKIRAVDNMSTHVATIKWFLLKEDGSLYDWMTNERLK